MASGNNTPPRSGRSNAPFAQVLILPVDASPVFEASSPKQNASAAMQLERESLIEVAKAWANARKATENKHPGLFILAPVKCETYFNDNLPIGLKKDSSRELKDRICHLFSEIIEQVTDEDELRDFIEQAKMPEGEITFK